MKNNFAKITLFFLAVTALVAVPVASRAADGTNAPATSAPTPKKQGGLPFHGKVAAVDPVAAMTFTVGTMTIAVTSKTRITKDGQPAVFADITTKATVGGSCKKDATGKFTAITVRVGEKKKQAGPGA